MSLFYNKIKVSLCLFPNASYKPTSSESNQQINKQLNADDQRDAHKAVEMSVASFMSLRLKDNNRARRRDETRPTNLTSSLPVIALDDGAVLAMV